MRRSGSTLAEILMAGQWKSIAFLKLVDEVRMSMLCDFVVHTSRSSCEADLEKDTAFAVAIESDEEEWIE